MGLFGQDRLIPARMAFFGQDTEASELRGHTSYVKILDEAISDY
jgi:hypothetical protein